MSSTSRFASFFFGVATLSVLIAAGGCSVGSTTVILASDAGPRSGVIEAKNLVDLTDAERSQLCDALAASEGGYGSSRTVSCDGGRSVTSRALPSQAVCTKGLSTVPTQCPATVANMEDCFAALTVTPYDCEPLAGLPSSCSTLADPVCGLVKMTTPTAPPDDDAAPPASCTTSSQCINGSCKCTAGPNTDAPCQTADKTAPDYCETLCKSCH